MRDDHLENDDDDDIDDDGNILSSLFHKIPILLEFSLLSSKNRIVNFSRIDPNEADRIL